MLLVRRMLSRDMALSNSLFKATQILSGGGTILGMILNHVVWYHDPYCQDNEPLGCCFLASAVSDKKRLDEQIGVPLWAVYHFSLATFESLFHLWFSSA